MPSVPSSVSALLPSVSAYPYLYASSYAVGHSHIQLDFLVYIIYQHQIQANSYQFLLPMDDYLYHNLVQYYGTFIGGGGGIPIIIACCIIIGSGGCSIGS